MLGLEVIPSLETLQRRAKALEVEVYQLFFEGEGKLETGPAFLS